MLLLRESRKAVCPHPTNVVSRPYSSFLLARFAPRRHPVSLTTWFLLGSQCSFFSRFSDKEGIVEQASQAAKSTIGLKTNEAKGEAAANTGELKGNAQDMAGEAKGKAQDMAGEAKGKAQEMAGEAKGKAQELKGEAKSKM